MKWPLTSSVDNATCVVHAVLSYKVHWTMANVHYFTEIQFHTQIVITLVPEPLLECDKFAQGWVGSLWILNPSPPFHSFITFCLKISQKGCVSHSAKTCISFPFSKFPHHSQDTIYLTVPLLLLKWRHTDKNTWIFMSWILKKLYVSAMLKTSPFSWMTVHCLYRNGIKWGRLE